MFGSENAFCFAQLAAIEAIMKALITDSVTVKMFLYEYLSSVSDMKKQDGGAATVFSGDKALEVPHNNNDADGNSSDNSSNSFVMPCHNGISVSIRQTAAPIVDEIAVIHSMHCVCFHV